MGNFYSFYPTKQLFFLPMKKHLSIFIPYIIHPQNAGFWAEGQRLRKHFLEKMWEKAHKSYLNKNYILPRLQKKAGQL